MRVKFIFIFSAFVFTSSCLFAHESLKSVEEEYYDFLSIQGKVQRPTLGYRTLSDNEWFLSEDEEHIWKDNNLGNTFALVEGSKGENWFTRGIDKTVKVKLYGPEWFSSYNTNAPYGQNDGALWQGVGYNTSLTTGARLEGYGFELTFKPQIAWSQNKDFDFMSPDSFYESEYAYYAGPGTIGQWIDFPQRFGDASFYTFDWGDSEVRYTWRTLTLGVGFQSMWLGPAYLNPMLGSNNAPTYPKFDMGMRRQSVVIPGLDWYMGDIEGRVWIGYLTESDYFDSNPDNDHTMIAGFNASFAPSLFPGLTLTANKVCLCYWDDKSIKYLFPLYDSNTPQEDQKYSVGFDWLFTPVQFEVYGELGIDDYNTKSFANPFHTAIYTVGLKKEFAISKSSNIRHELIVEWNNFEMSQDYQSQQAYGGYYPHWYVKHGYTQKGQILGAGSGYMGTSQYFALKNYLKKGCMTLFVHFERPDVNYYYNRSVGTAYISEEWMNVKAVRTYGIDFVYYLNSNIVFNGSVANSWIINPFYDKEHSSIRNYSGSFCLKFII